MLHGGPITIKVGGITRGLIGPKESMYTEVAAKSINRKFLESNKITIRNVT